MNCPKCGGHMTMLFISYVCDACDPPKVAGVPHAHSSKKARGVYRYWIRATGQQDYAFSGGYDGCWTAGISKQKDLMHTVQVESEVQLDVNKKYNFYEILIYSKDKDALFDYVKNDIKPNTVWVRVLSPDEVDDA